MKEARLSAEQMGEMMGISGMTIRRWKDMPGNQPLDPLYERALTSVVFRLVAEGKLSDKSKAAKSVIAAGFLPFSPAAKSMGLSDEALERFRNDPQNGIETLSQIGSDAKRKSVVDRSQVFADRVGDILERLPLALALRMTSGQRGNGHGETFLGFLQDNLVLHDGVPSSIRP